jgi:hypothetical protein
MRPNPYQICRQVEARRIAAPVLCMYFNPVLLVVERVAFLFVLTALCAHNHDFALATEALSKLLILFVSL